jgi:hypothetical protein
MPFQIAKRAGHLGDEYRAKPTTVKEERFTRQALNVRNVRITDVEYGHLVLNDSAPKHFWKGKKEPALAYPHLGVQTLSSTMRECKVDLWLQDRILTLEDCTITKSRIVLLDRREALWAFTIQALPNLNDLTLALMQTLGQPILIAIDCPTWGAQKDLLREAAEKEDDEDEDDETEPLEGELLKKESQPGSPEHLAEIAEEQGKSRMQRNIESMEEHREKKAKRARKKKS